MKSSTQPPHSIAISNSTAKKQAHRKWRRQINQYLSHGRGPKKKPKVPNKEAVATKPTLVAFTSGVEPDARKGSKSLFLM